MSVEALTWALNQAPVEDAGAAAVLVGLANHASPDGRRCWPSVERLAYYARMSERTVRRHLRALEEAGVIVRDEDTRARDAETRADQRPTAYRLVMNGATRETYETRRDRERAERQKSDGGSICPPVASGGQIDRGDNDDSTGGQIDPRTVTEPSLPTTPTELLDAPAREDDNRSIDERPQLALVDAPDVPAKGKRVTATKLPEDWTPDEVLLAKTREQYPNVNIAAEIVRFRRHFHGTGKRWQRWDLAWLNWCDRARQGRAGRAAPFRNTQQTGESIAAKWTSYRRTQEGPQ